MQVDEIVEIVEEEKIEVPTLLRTYKQGVFQVYKDIWGSYIAPTFDPDANIVEIKEEQFKLFELNDNINKIPKDLWSAWIDLAFYFSAKINQNVEVSIRILRSDDDPTKYRFLLPLQEVSGGRVNAANFQKSVDIISGEKLESYPPIGWTAVGSSHSHNTMPPFFSGVDDTYELTDPGLHIVVGHINQDKNTYDLVASVTGNKRRFDIDENSVVDLDIDDVTQTYHKNVLDYVSTVFGRFFKPKTPKVNKNFVPLNLKGANTNHVTNVNTNRIWQGVGSWDYRLNQSQKSDERGDPFHYSEFFNQTVDDESACFDIETLIYAYIESNSGDVNKLNKIIDILGEGMDTAKLQIEDLIEFVESDDVIPF